MDSLINEINEDVRRAQMAAFWRRYGRQVSLALLAVIVLAAALAGWQHYQRKAAVAASEQFIGILEKGRSVEIAAELGAFAEGAPRAYRALAGFQQAGMLVDANEPDAALAVYQSLGNKGGLPAAYGHLARIYAATILLDQGKAEEALTELAPTLADSSPYVLAGRELYALAAARTGKVTEARAELEKTVNDPASLPSSRERAVQLLYLLNGGPGGAPAANSGQNSGEPPHAG